MKNPLFQVRTVFVSDEEFIARVQASVLGEDAAAEAADDVKHASARYVGATNWPTSMLPQCGGPTTHGPTLLLSYCGHYISVLYRHDISLILPTANHTDHFANSKVCHHDQILPLLYPF